MFVTIRSFDRFDVSTAFSDDSDPLEDASVKRPSRTSVASPYLLLWYLSNGPASSERE